MNHSNTSDRTSSIQPITIALSNVKKYFGPTRALDGVSLTVSAGEIHAIVGGNGSGKSTLAKVVSGILGADSGTVSILGETPTTPAESRAVGIATVFQEILVADECSVVDNLFMGSDSLFTKLIPNEEKVHQAEQIMYELSGEYVSPHSLVGTLPLNLKQWITIGRAMLMDPKILILDESSAALDLDSTQRLFNKMRQMRDAGVSILIVTHRIAELIEISDKATVLRDGRDVGVLEKEQITEENLLTLMTGEDQAKSAHSQKPIKPERHDVVMRAEGLAIWSNGKAFDFELLKGEIVGIAGLDGQGQSEFVQTLAGIEAARSGIIQVFQNDGSTHEIDNLDSAQESKVVYISGDRKREGIFASLSIFENMMMPLYRLKTWGRKTGIIDWSVLSASFKREVENLLIKFGARNDFITSLSGGNQQKVLIGRGFALRPNIMVLNDPARGIDGGAKAELYRHLRKFAEGGKSVVYMSSELEEFVGFASRVIVFRNGSPFDAFDGDYLNGNKILEAMFGQSDSSGLSNNFPITREVETENKTIAPLDELSDEHLPDAQQPNNIIADNSPLLKTRQIRVVEFGDDGQVISGSTQ